MANLRKIDAVFLLAYEFGQDVYETHTYTIGQIRTCLNSHSSSGADYLTVPSQDEIHSGGIGQSPSFEEGVRNCATRPHCLSQLLHSTSRRQSGIPLRCGVRLHQP